MAIATKPFHPLDVENNRRYKVTKKESPKIGWHKTEETGDMTGKDISAFRKMEPIISRFRLTTTAIWKSMVNR